MSKYHNQKTEIDGILFDSKAESDKYLELKLMMHDHSPDGVKKFTCQPRFELLAPFTHELTGKKHKGITYVADFDVIYNDGRREIIDVKGIRTDVFNLKCKLFDFKYPDLILVLE